MSTETPAGTVRITVGKGATRQTFVLEYPPYPEVGDELTLPDKSRVQVRRLVRLKEPIYHVDFPGLKAES